MKYLSPLVFFLLLLFVSFGYPTSISADTPTPTAVQIDIESPVDAPFDIWKLLRDPMWQFIGSIIGILAIVVGTFTAIVIYLQQTYKALSYGVFSRPLLTTATKAVKGDVQIVLDGQPIDSPLLILLKITNSGSQPIEEKDYAQPLFAIVNGQVISSSVSNSSSNALRKHIKYEVIEDTQLKFDNQLLNKGDWFEVQILISNTSVDNKHSVTLEGRIAGVKEIKEVRYETAIQNNWARGMMIRARIAILLMVLLFVVLLPQSDLWLDFGYLLSNDEYFRSGFFAATVLSIAIAIIWRLLFALNVQFKKILQFLEPPKQLQ